MAEVKNFFDFDIDTISLHDTLFACDPDDSLSLELKIKLLEIEEILSHWSGVKEIPNSLAKLLARKFLPDSLRKRGRDSAIVAVHEYIQGL